MIRKSGHRFSDKIMLKTKSLLHGRPAFPDRVVALPPVR
jgi:hypothetical protein